MCFDPATARDIIDAFRVFEGRLQGTGRRLSEGARELVAAAEGSGGVKTSRLMDTVTVGADDAGMAALLTTSEVSEMARLSVSAVKRLVKSGELASVTIGRCRRIHPTDLAVWTEGLRTAATNEGNLGMNEKSSSTAEAGS